MHSSSSLSHTFAFMPVVFCGVWRANERNRLAIRVRFFRQPLPESSMDCLLWLMAHIVATVYAQTQGELFWALQGSRGGQRPFFPWASDGSQEDDLARLGEAIRVRSFFYRQGL